MVPGNYPFSPLAAGVSTSTSGTSQSVDLGDTGGNVVVVSNTSGTAANIIHVRVGSGTQTATTADCPVFALSTKVFTIPEEDPQIGVIAAAGTPAMVTQVGFGGIIS